MEKILSESILEGAGSQIEMLLGNYLDQIYNLFLIPFILISIPAVLIAIANCFFGYKIFRVMLVINCAITGGVVGAVIFIIASGGDNFAMMGILGFFLFGAIFGVLAWFGYMVFLFLQSFGIGFSVFSTIILFASGFKQVVAAMIIGLIAGIALGVLVCIYSKWVIMVTTAISGAMTLASFFGVITRQPIVYSLGIVGFAVGGFLTQYFIEKKNPTNFGQAKAAGYYRQQNPQQYTYQQPPQQPVQPVQNSVCKLVGVEGVYKGFEFDIDKNTTFGRDVDRCNIIFADDCKGVSKVQCELIVYAGAGEVAIMDKYSSFGTSVNGRKLEKDDVHTLADGDVIMFGENNVFKVKY